MPSRARQVGTLSQGEYIISLMNAAGYDLAVPGNHEFDYGVDRLMELAAGAEFPYLSCNFTAWRRANRCSSPMLSWTTGHHRRLCGDLYPGEPDQDRPHLLPDEAGEAVYGFRQGGDGQELYDCVQAAVDQARAEGADYVGGGGAIWVMRASLPSGPPRLSLPTPPASTCS